jgi:hypothetical protein
MTWYNFPVSHRVRRAVLLAAFGLGALAGPAVAAPVPVCLTPVAADGFEPPCNPFLSSPTWGASHRSSYAQASSPYPGPRAGDPVRVQHTVGVPGVPLIFDFTEPYADGGRVAWTSTISTPDGRYVAKIDAQTGRLIARYGFDNEPQVPILGSISGVYNLLDRDNHLIVGRGRSIDVYGDAIPGNRLSAIKHLKQFTFPDSALCGPDDKIIGITMLFDGRLAFASLLGIVGTIPREVDRMTAANLVTTPINGARCTTAKASDNSLDQTSNSIAADENGGIFVVTSKAMYRYQWDGKALGQTWRAPYKSGGAPNPARGGEGSGSTPTLMGTGPKQDRFVVITDGATLMSLDLFWRDEIPADWKGLPGRDRRLACEIPITFGDPNATKSQNEQSVLVRGYGSVIANNQLKNDDALLAIPPGIGRNAAAALAGGSPANAPFGIERVDWNPKTRTCGVKWANRELSIPNGVPSMSTDSGLIYGMGQRGGVFGLEGIDFATGASKLRVDGGASPDFNSAYSATTVGPDGAIWTGGFAALTLYRGPARQAPPRACLDITPPSSRVRVRRSGTAQRTTLSRTRVTVAGSARDFACGAQTARSVKTVGVSVQLRVTGGCRALTANRRLGATRPCTERTWLRSRLDKRHDRYLLRTSAHLPKGRYLVTSQAVDARGNHEVGRPSARLPVR